MPMPHVVCMGELLVEFVATQPARSSGAIPALPTAAEVVAFTRSAGVG